MTTNETYDLDADIIAAANPYGCNQYGHREGHGDEGTTEAKTKHLNANAEKLSKMLDLQELQNSGASADKIAKAKKELQEAERNWANAGSELKRKEQEAQARKKARESTPAAPSKTVTTATNKELKRQMSEAKDLYADDDYGVAGDKAYAEHEENIKDVGNNWRSGSFSAGGRTYKVQMQIYPRSHKDEASQFGIEGGDISKFWVRDDNGDVVVNYDRGWDIKPKKEETKMMMRTLLEKYNGTKEDADSVKSSRASGYDLDAEILLAANPYRIPTDADLVEAERGCNQYKHKTGCPEADENHSGEIKRISGKRIVSHKIEKSFFFPTEDDARRFNIAKDAFLEELDPDGYLPETNYRNKKLYVVFGNLFVRNTESKGKAFTNLSDEDYRDLWNAENEVAGAYLDFNEERTPDNLEAIRKREREYDKVRLKLEKKYFKDKR